jgi:hypothetical protein
VLLAARINEFSKTKIVAKQQLDLKAMNFPAADVPHLIDMIKLTIRGTPSCP